MKVSFPAFALSLLFASHALAAETIQALVSSNGRGTLAWSVPQKRFDRFLQHPYKFESQDVATRDLLVDGYFGVAFSKSATASSAWLPDLAVQSAAYVPGTAIIKVTQQLAGVTVTTYGFAPRALAGSGFVLLAEIDNTSGTSLTGVSLYSLLNQRMGAQRPEPSGTGEYIQYNLSENGFEEFGPFNASAAASVAHPLGPVTRRTSGGGSTDPSYPTNPYSLLAQPFSNLIADAGSTTGYNANDLASGFQWELGTLVAGAKAWAGVVVSYDHANVSAEAWSRVSAWKAGLSTPDALLTREIAAWASTSPAGLSLDEAALYKQSLAVLKMAQVEEAGSGYGQILASPAASTATEYNQWNITWVRDMAYSTVALAEAGQFEQARAALEFQLLAQVGDYQTYVGAPYQISVCRYFGDGREESDSNADGPNIEFDGFGLFLWSLGRYTALSGDETLAQSYWPLIQSKIADVLVGLVDPSNGLIRADSSIWETHWNGKERQFAYTQITAISGLCAAGDLADELGGNGATYRNAARQLRKALREELVTGSSVIASSIEELSGSYYDAAVLDAFALRVLDPNSPIAHATVDALLANLSLPNNRGLFRNDDGGDYDKQEWVFINLRLVAALEASMRAQDAQTKTRILSWVVQQSRQNKDLIAELYDANTAAYAGSVPMAGFGAGAFVLAMHERLSPAGIACGSYADDLEQPGVGGSTGATGTTGASGTEDEVTPVTTVKPGKLKEENQATLAKPETSRGCSSASPAFLPALLVLLWLRLIRRNQG